MKIYTLRRIQVIDTSLDEAWSFFSKPANLKEITPSYMDFRVTSQLMDQPMYAGMIISYIVRPLLRWPIHWVTEISHVEPLKYFVDEQRVGPYRLWHHQHFFCKVENGVEMIDLVHYALPMGPLGRLLHHLFIKNQLNSIFEYRYKKTESLFNVNKAVVV